MDRVRVGVGTDIESVERFRRLNRTTHRRFFAHVFTAAELAYCFTKTDPAPHLAARWCAKEAVVKALGSMGIHRVPYRAIGITHDRGGAPRVRVRLASSPVHVWVSLAHTHDFATAYAVVVRGRVRQNRKREDAVASPRGASALTRGTARALLG